MEISDEENGPGSPDAGDEVQWSLFSNPLDDFMKPLNPENDVRIVRDLAEIEITLSDYETTEDNPDFSFPAPNSAATRRVLCESLLRLSSYTRRLTVELVRNGRLTPAQKAKLDAVRRTLLELISDYPAEMAEMHTFQIASIDKSYRLDKLVFLAVLQCLCCIAYDPSTKKLLSTRSCSSEKMIPLLKEKVVPTGLHARTFDQYRLPDIAQSLKWLEANWLTMPFLNCLPSYLDLLLTRLAVICIVPQTDQVFGSIADYKQELSGNMFRFTERLLEDMCWTFVPMYRKLLVRKRISSKHVTGVAIPNEHRKKVQNLTVKNAEDMINKDLIGIFFKTYMKCGLRPSEKAKFTRNYPGKVFSVPTVIEKLRGEPSKKVIMEHLAKSPWIIVRQKLFDKVTTEILHVLLLDSFVSNITGLRWMNTFVEFNVQLMKQQELTRHLDRVYPRIVQDFNTFNLLHKGVLHMHNSIAKAYLHWLAIMLAPPFNGSFENKTLDLLQHHTPWKPHIGAHHLTEK